MTPEDFIRFAGLLVAKFPADEAAVRTAVSRAYYGAFHLAVELLHELSISQLDHGSIRRYLMESGVMAAVEAGSKLNDLQSDRVKPDYRLDSKIDVPFAKANVERAQMVHDLLSRFDADAAKLELLNGINAYRQRMKGNR